MKRLAMATAGLLVALVTTRGLAQDLPAAIQVDRHLIQAERQIKDGDYGAAVEALDRVLQLVREHSLEIPSAFWFKYALASHQAGLHPQAMESATRYLRETGQSGEHYRATLELLDDIESAAPGPFTVHAEPAHAQVRLVNSGLRYRPGMMLSPGDYRLEVTAARHEATVRTFRHEASSGSEHWIALTPWSGGERFRDCAQCPEMVVLPAGTFRMGCVSGRSCRRAERPVHEVRIAKPFALSIHEVTFANWDACVDAAGCNGYRPRAHYRQGNRPVVQVSWEDAQAYAAWLSGQTGAEYRLPSESEWEYAARAGTATRYSWGNEKGKNRANCVGCGSRWSTYKTAPVGSFAANPWGLHDVHGNVDEWTEDCWNRSYSGAPAEGRAWLEGNCEDRVLRGGSNGDQPGHVRSASRFGTSMGKRWDDLGFRIALTISP